MDYQTAISLVSVRNIANGNLGTITDDAAADASGSIYIADTVNGRVRKVSTDVV